MCIMCPLAILFLNGETVKTKTKKTIKIIDSKIKISSVISHPYFDLFFVSIINIFLPLFVTFSNPLWFIFVAGGLHTLRIWVDYLRK